MKKILLIASGALLLAACNGSPSADVAETPAPATSAASDEWQFCETFVGSIEPTSDLLLNLAADPTGESIDRALLESTTRDQRELVALAPAEISSLVSDYTTPLLTLEAILAGEADNQHLDTGALKDAMLPLTTFCAETVGYSTDG